MAKGAVERERNLGNLVQAPPLIYAAEQGALVSDPAIDDTPGKIQPEHGIETVPRLRKVTPCPHRQGTHQCAERFAVTIDESEFDAKRQRITQRFGIDMSLRANFNSVNPCGVDGK